MELMAGDLVLALTHPCSGRGQAARRELSYRKQTAVLLVMPGSPALLHCPLLVWTYPYPVWTRTRDRQGTDSEGSVG